MSSTEAKAFDSFLRKHKPKPRDDGARVALVYVYHHDGEAPDWWPRDKKTGALGGFRAAFCYEDVQDLKHLLKMSAEDMCGIIDKTVEGQ